MARRPWARNGRHLDRLLEFIAELIVWAAMLVALAAVCSACANCPKCEPEIVRVEADCKLPPPITLIPFGTEASGCPDEWVCFDGTNATRLALHIAELRQWVMETRARCGTRATD